jgi:SAM-dependent MidA family methyltransferase
VKLDVAVAARLRSRLFSFHDFVEAALFHPRWGYYASGAVRFGDGGHFDTFPLALSPYFGLMVAARAKRVWRAFGSPPRFEICEIGAGNGQLCLDVLSAAELRARRDDAWRRFASALRYRIVEKSAALRRRQAALLGPVATRVTWDAIELSRGAPPAARARAGLVVVNEVLDCLAHHKVVLGARGDFRVAFVGATRPGSASLLPWPELSAALARGERLRFKEILLPVDTVPRLRKFLDRHYGDVVHRLQGTRRHWTYYACPATEAFVASLGALYRRSEILLVDYGGDRHYHLHTPAAARISAGRPEERSATPYRAPGRDDITFLVDFSVAMNAARAAGLEVRFFGPQGKLASLSGVRLGESAAATIVRHRALAWLLALAGVGPERRQRAAALSWTCPPGRRRRRTLAQEAHDAIEEFLGRRASAFHLLVLRRGATGRRVSARRPRERAVRADRRRSPGRVRHAWHRALRRRPPPARGE